MNNGLDFAKMATLIGKPQQAPQPPPNPFGDIGFGPLMAILAQQRIQQQHQADDEATYQAGYQAADQYLRRARR